MKVKITDDNKFKVDFGKDTEDKLLNMLRKLCKMKHNRVFKEVAKKLDWSFLLTHWSRSMLASEPGRKLNDLVVTDNYTISLENISKFIDAMYINYSGYSIIIHFKSGNLIKLRAILKGETRNYDIGIKDIEDNTILLSVNTSIYGLRFLSIRCIEDTLNKSIDEVCRSSCINCIAIGNSGRSVTYNKVVGIFEIVYNLKMLTDKEKEEDSIICKNSKNVKIYDFCKQLVVLGCNSGLAIKLNSVDPDLEPCMLLIDNGEVTISLLKDSLPNNKMEE